MQSGEISEYFLLSEYVLNKRPVHGFMKSSGTFMRHVFITANFLMVGTFRG